MNSKLSKVLFILPSLRAGGAERVISFIAHKIDKERFTPVLLVMGYKKDVAYDISKTKTIFLNKKRLLSSIGTLFFRILKEKPAIVVSSIGHVNVLMGLFSVFFYKTKFIAREASVISEIQKTLSEKKTKKIRQSSLLVRCLYIKLDTIICQSSDMLEDLHYNYEIPKRKLVVINNPITHVFPVKGKVSYVQSKISFITVGRLSKEKGHERILRILSQFSIPYHYTIIGSGPEKENINQQIDDLGIRAHITYIPFTDKVSSFLSTNDIFLQGSYVEGFPNAVLESCVVGTPVIAFNAPGGTKEIISSGINGYLVDTEEEFLTTLTKVCTSKEFQDPNIISDFVKERFNEQFILEKYETLFMNSLRKKV